MRRVGTRQWVTELHSVRAGGEQAEVEGHEGMAHDAEVGGVQGLMGRSAGHALLGGGGCCVKSKTLTVM